jgi:pyrroline-5-carboxylate reductase
MKIAILGYGNMGSAIAGRLKDKHELFIFDKDKSKTIGCPGMTVAENLDEFLKSAGTLILAIKPQDFDEILGEIKKHSQIRLVISIAAGIPIAYIESKLDDLAVMRVMPNLPAKIGAGMICLSRGKHVSDTDLFFSRALFNQMGKTLVVAEKMMDAVTAVSGSGPGFFYELLGNRAESDWDKFIQNEFIPELSLAAQSVGFSPEEARILSTTTAQGSLALLKDSQSPPWLLKGKVASKGGTTEAGLAVLQGKIGNLGGAVKAALKRSEELSKK